MSATLTVASPVSNSLTAGKLPKHTPLVVLAASWLVTATLLLTAVTGLAIAPLYDEPFVAVLPVNHPLAVRESISSDELKNETMLLLGTGHCFRDHVLEVCPEFARFSSNAEGIRKSFEGSSLETIKHMVASGMGVTLVPRLSVPAEALKPKPKGRKELEQIVRYLPVRDGEGREPPMRRVVLAWRRSFTRYEAIAALRNAIYACELPGVKRLS